MQKTTQISIILMEEIKALADQGYSIKKITDLLPVFSATVIRVLK
ncbi:hypothetical protein [Streptococcus sp. 121]|nr:hypothetical protein [Streptococcus sp. 121]